MYERLHRIYLRMREEECTCQVFAAVAVDALWRSFETAVERKQGISQLELLYAEITREEQQKQLRKEQKKLKRKRKKGKLPEQEEKENEYEDGEDDDDKEDTDKDCLCDKDKEEESCTQCEELSAKNCSRKGVKPGVNAGDKNSDRLNATLDKSEKLNNSKAFSTNEIFNTNGNLNTNERNNGCSSKERCNAKEFVSSDRLNLEGLNTEGFNTKGFNTEKCKSERINNRKLNSDRLNTDRFHSNEGLKHKDDGERTHNGKSKDSSCCDNGDKLNEVWVADCKCESSSKKGGKKNSSSSCSLKCDNFVATNECNGKKDNGNSSDHSHDCGYSSENNNGCCETTSVSSSLPSSPEGSEVACHEDGCCHQDYPLGRILYGNTNQQSLQEMLDVSKPQPFFSISMFSFFINIFISVL